jgi:hypothetical protein
MIVEELCTEEVMKSWGVVRKNLFRGKKNVTLLEVFQALPTRPSDKDSTKGKA